MKNKILIIGGGLLSFSIGFASKMLYDKIKENKLKKSFITDDAYYLSKAKKYCDLINEGDNDVVLMIDDKMFNKDDLYNIFSDGPVDSIDFLEKEAITDPYVCASDISSILDCTDESLDTLTLKLKSNASYPKVDKDIIIDVEEVESDIITSTQPEQILTSSVYDSFLNPDENYQLITGKQQAILLQNNSPFIDDVVELNYYDSDDVLVTLDGEFIENVDELLGVGTIDYDNFNDTEDVGANDCSYLRLLNKTKKIVYIVYMHYESFFSLEEE